MRRIQKAFVLFLLAITLIMSVIPVAFSAVPTAFAQAPTSLLPGLAQGKACDEFNIRNGILDKETEFKNKAKDTAERTHMLACAVRLGKLHLFMLPFFIGYFVQFLLLIGGLIAVLFVVYGGYQYAVGGLIEDKESGKKTITHALVGVVVSLAAWIIVNFVMVALTS